MSASTAGKPPKGWIFLGLETTSPANESQSTVEDFLKDEELWQAHPRGFVLKIVQQALTKKQVKLKIFRDAGFLLVFVVGVHDRMMMALAKSSPKGFPRGFCIVLAHDQACVHGLRFIANSAFLDKFTNDNRTTDTPLQEFEGTSIRIAQKVSGSLSLLTAFVWKDQKYALFTAKNSTGNVFSIQCASLLLNWFEDQQQNFDDFLEYLCERSFVCAFEVCSMADGMGQHGSTYKKNVTIALLLAHRNSMDKIIKVVPDEVSVPKLCQLGVPVLSRWVSSSSAGRDQVLSELISRRDWLTNSTFESILERAVKAGQFSVVKGNLSHSIMSDILEGLVIWTSANRLIKFKLARYTVMTMCLRPLIEKNGGNVSDGAARRQISTFLTNWVLSPEGRDLYESVVRFVIYRLRSKENLNSMTANTYLDYTEPLVQEFLDDVERGKASIPDEQLEDPVQVFLVVGTVGWGKSTLLRQLETDYGIVPLSFDECEENTKGAGSTKNSRLWGSAAFHLSRSRSVVIENGGGAFLGKVDPVFKNIMARCSYLPNLELILIVPDEFANGLENEEAAKRVKQAMLDQTNRVVIERFQKVDPSTGEAMYQVGSPNSNRDRPDMRIFASEKAAQGILRGVSQKNFHVCRKLMALFSTSNFKVITYQRDSDRTKLSEPLRVRIPTGVKTLGKYMLAIQGSVVVEKNDRYIGHVTISYGASAAASNDFWDCRRSFSCRVRSRALRVGDTRQGKGKIAALLLDLKKTNPISRHLSEDQVPHMSIESPYSASWNNFVLTRGLQKPAGEGFEVEIDGKEYSAVLETELSTEINLHTPYCYAMTNF